MSWAWERRIRHIDRRVSPLEMRGMRGRVIKMRVRERRGLPARVIPLEIVMYRLGLNTEMTPRRAAWLQLRHILLERKRIARVRALRARRPKIEDTGIFGARRRAEWLRQAEANVEFEPLIANIGIQPAELDGSPARELGGVKLSTGIPDHGLERGKQGTIVEMLDDQHALVEFAGDDGKARAMVPIALSQLQPVKLVGVLPAWACADCGAARAGPVRGDVTWLQGWCGICGLETQVTEFLNFRGSTIGNEEQ